MNKGLRYFLLALILSGFMFSIGFLLGQRWHSPSTISSSGPQRIRMMVTPEPEKSMDRTITFYSALEGDRSKSYQDIQIKNRIDETKASKEARLHPPPSGTLFSVQVGSYRKKEDAHLRMEALKRNGFNDTYITMADDKGRFYRVRLGHFNTRKDAQRMAEKIKAKTGWDAIVVRYEKAEGE